MQRDYRDYLRVETKRNATFILVCFSVITMLLAAQLLEKGEFNADDEGEEKAMKLMLLQCGSVVFFLGALVLISNYYHIKVIELAGIFMLLPQVIIVWTDCILEPQKEEEE